MSTLLRFLDSKFKLKYFLGLEVAQTCKRFSFSQRKYVLEILLESGYLGSKLVKTPIEQSLKLSRSDGSLLKDPTTYRKLVGRLLYLTIAIPNITFVVHNLSQFMESLSYQLHLHATYRILQCIKGSSSQGSPSQACFFLRYYLFI